MRLGVLAGEASGDILGGSVATELKQRFPDLELAGIGGECLSRAGLESFRPMDRLSVMGLIDPLKRLPELLAIRRDVYEQQLGFAPQCFLGIDSPDFNLTLERRLREQGIKTAHLVSPTVWAWRSGRIKSIAKSVDLMLCLLPFELPIYEAAGIPAACVGHPLIEELTSMPDRATTRTSLGIGEGVPLVAVLPGSRASEVATLMPVFAETMALLYATDSRLQFLIPAANSARRQQIEQIMAPFDVPVSLTDGRGREVMQAADAALLASGTASLEAMLLRTPMVISWRTNWLSWQILSRMATTEYIGLPNIIAGRGVVPELLQGSAEPALLARAVMDALERGDQTQLPVFEELAGKIGTGFAGRCCDALEPLLLS